MIQALAVVLLLNGTQISLPRPALLLNGAVWVPVRAVCLRVGAQVSPGRVPSEIIVTAAGKRHVFGPTALGGRRLAGLTYQSGGATYVPGRDLARCLQGRCEWLPQKRRAELSLRWIGAVAEPCADELAADPLSWVGRQVSVTGRHLGRLASPLSPSLASRPPTADATVLGGGRPIYVSIPHSGSQLGAGPLSGLGEAMDAEGTVDIAPSGGTYLRSFAIRRDVGAGGAAPWLLPDRNAVRKGEALWFEVSGPSARGGLARDASSPRPAPIVLLGPPSGGPDVRLPTPASGSAASTVQDSRRGAGYWLLWRAPVSRGREDCGTWSAAVGEEQHKSTIEGAFEVAPAGEALVRP